MKAYRPKPFGVAVIQLATGKRVLLSRCATRADAEGTARALRAQGMPAEVVEGPDLPTGPGATLPEPVA